MLLRKSIRNHFKRKDLHFPSFFRGAILNFRGVSSSSTHVRYFYCLLLYLNAFPNAQCMRIYLHLVNFIVHVVSGISIYHCPVPFPTICGIQAALKHGVGTPETGRMTGITKVPPLYLQMRSFNGTPF